MPHYMGQFQCDNCRALCWFILENYVMQPENYD